MFEFWKADTSIMSDCLVWLMGLRIIGPYFFENMVGLVDTVNDVRYRGVLTNVLYPEIEDMVM